MKTTFVSIEEASDIDGGTAVVVVDVMRAFTTAAWAFHRRATKIVLFAGLDEALAYKAKTSRALAFCDGAPKPGFDLFNSPAHLLDLEVAGRSIAQRTTAGTQGAIAARHADLILCTGFVTAAATARHLRDNRAKQVTFVVTGGDDDLACAEHISSLLHGDDPGTRYVDEARRSPAAADLLQGVGRGYRGVDPADVDMCLELDRFDFAMQASPEADLLVLTPTSPT